MIKIERKPNGVLLSEVEAGNIVVIEGDLYMTLDTEDKDNKREVVDLEDFSIRSFITLVKVVVVSATLTVDVIENTVEY